MISAGGQCRTRVGILRIDRYTGTDVDTTMGEKYRKKSNVYATPAYNSTCLRKAFAADDFTDVTRVIRNSKVKTRIGFDACFRAETTVRFYRTNYLRFFTYTPWLGKRPRVLPALCVLGIPDTSESFGIDNGGPIVCRH